MLVCMERAWTDHQYQFGMRYMSLATGCRPADAVAVEIMINKNFLFLPLTCFSCPKQKAEKVHSYGLLPEPPYEHCVSCQLHRHNSHHLAQAGAHTRAA
jgi:hypothetical protein